MIEKQKFGFWHFDITKLHYGWLLTLNLIQHATPYAIFDASAKTCNSVSVSVDTYYLSKATFCMSGRLSSCFCQLFVRSEGNNSSQSILLFQICSMIHYGSIKVGAISANGSKIEITRDRIPCLVVKTYLLYILYEMYPSLCSIISPRFVRLVYRLQKGWFLLILERHCSLIKLEVLSDCLK